MEFDIRGNVPEGGSLDRIPTDDGSEVFEYCVLEQVGEAGIYEEVCYEIIVPEGCELITPEAGIYIVECEEDAPVVVNPLFLDIPVVYTSPAWQPDDRVIPSNDDGTTTVEYCIYEEVQEAGVFEEVCYEIEIPEGCILTTAEAGVYTVDCPEEGGTVMVNPILVGSPKYLPFTRCR